MDVRFDTRGILPACLLIIICFSLIGCSPELQPTLITPLVFPDQPANAPGMETKASPTLLPSLTPLPTIERYRPSLPLFMTPLSTTMSTPAAIPATGRTPAPTGRLARYGTWAFIPSREGLWAMDGNGFNVTLLTNDPVYHMAVSPQGRLVAYLTHADPFNVSSIRPFGYTLKVLNPYSGEIITVAQVDPTGVSADSSYEELNNAYQLILAYEHRAMVWSPGGNLLAFTSAHEGQDGEVYIYNKNSQAVTRLTDREDPAGFSHTFNLTWSPYGDRVFHSRAYRFGDGRSHMLAGAWVVSTRGALYPIAGPESVGENLITWINNNLALLSSVHPECGEHNLRTLNVVTREETVMWSGCFNARVYERRRGEVLVSVPPEFAATTPGGQTGLLRIRLWDGRINQFSTRSFDRLYSGSGSAAWLGYNPGEGISAIQLDGQVIPLVNGTPEEDPQLSNLSPLRAVAGQDQWLWAGRDGLFLVQNNAAGEPELFEIFPVRPEGLTESPQQSGLYFFYAYEGSTASLLAMRAGEWQPYLVDERIQTPVGISWN